MSGVSFFYLNFLLFGRHFNDSIFICRDITNVDEKFENFTKNVSEIVKCSDEKFYKTLSDNKYKSTRIDKYLREEEVEEEEEGDGDGGGGGEDQVEENQNDDVKKQQVITTKILQILDFYYLL